MSCRSSRRRRREKLFLVVALSGISLTTTLHRPALCSIGKGNAFAVTLHKKARIVRYSLPKVNYDLDDGASKATPGSERAAAWRYQLENADIDAAAFDQDRLIEYILARPFEIFTRAVSTAWVALGIWWAWRTEKDREESEGELLTLSLSRKGPTTARGEALRNGLQNMGVFFVKVGQTAAQRPDIVGDEIAEELKGLQEKSTPFSDEVALRIIAEDLDHKGPLAPGVLWDGCADPSGQPLLAELNPKHIASASLGQVYRGRLHDGREVALKVQRPAVRDVLGLDWAVAIAAVKALQSLLGSPNDYAAVVDTVAKGIRMELDYHNEAANAEEFAQRHAFLPFVSSPGAMPELMGPVGKSRILALNWYPSRAPKELSRSERRTLVEMAVEACVVQLLVTGFVHADPHEGNLRCGEDGRVVFLDFGLMDRVDFGIMESCAAGVRHVLRKDWLELSKVFQQVRFTPTPMMRNVAYGIESKPRYEPCNIEGFAKDVGEQIEKEAGGQSRFGAMAVALKKLSARYLMLTPPFIALLCRTFITLEGLLADDPDMIKEYNVYKVALPFAIRRVFSPRTRTARVALRDTFLIGDSDGNAKRLRQSPRVNWSALSALLAASGDNSSSSSSTAPSNVDATSFSAASAGVQRRLLFTAEGSSLRRMLYDVDWFEMLRGFLVEADAKILRETLVQAVASRWSNPPTSTPHIFGPRSTASAKGWGTWNEDDPYKLPVSTVQHSRTAWRIIMRHQRRLFLKPWKLPLRLLQLLVQVLPRAGLLLLRASREARSQRNKLSR